MSRPSLRDRARLGARAGAPQQQQQQQDKFIGLVEKHPGLGSAAASAASGAVQSEDREISSSKLRAPFGNLSSASSVSAAGAARGRGAKGPKGASVVAPSADKVLNRLFAQARRTGALGMDNAGLSAFPEQVCHLYDEDAISQEEKVWECVDLVSISMQHNSITAIPKDIGNLAHLQSLILGHNKLPTLGNDILALEALKKLDVSHNVLQALPDDMGFAFQSLVELRVNNNSLAALPLSIVDIPRLEVLVAGNNRISSLPAEIGRLAFLLRLDLSSNALTSLPASLAELDRLSVLDLKQNRLAVLPSLQNMRALSELNVSENCLVSLPILPAGESLATLLAGFNRLTNVDTLLSARGIVTLDLHNNLLIDLPSGLGHPSSRLKLLDASNNDLCDIPGSLGLAPQLNKLLVEGNPLRKFPRAKLAAGAQGGIAALKKYLVTRIDVTKLKQLVGEEEALHLGAGEALAAEAEAVGGSSASSTQSAGLEVALRAAVATQSLSLSSIDPPLCSFPAQLLAAPHVRSLVSLDVSGVRWASSASSSTSSSSASSSSSSPSAAPLLPPPFIALLRATLRSFAASNCGLGSFPGELCGLEMLEELRLSRNSIASVPSGIGALERLRLLEMGNNSLRSFPSALYSLAPQLRRLDLRGNKVPSLPADFCVAFAGFEELDLSGNPISSLPSDGWSSMVSLSFLGLENLSLTALPLELGLLHSTLKTILLAGNPQKQLAPSVVSRGAAAVLQALKNKIPLDSPLLVLGEGGGGGAQKPQPRQTNSRATRDMQEDDGTIEVDTSQRDRYADFLANSSSSGAYSSAYRQGHEQRAYADRSDDRGFDDHQPPRGRGYDDGRGYGDSYSGGGGRGSDHSQSQPRSSATPGGRSQLFESSHSQRYDDRARGGGNEDPRDSRYSDSRDNYDPRYDDRSMRGSGYGQAAPPQRGFDTNSDSRYSSSQARQPAFPSSSGAYRSGSGSNSRDRSPDRLRAAANSSYSYGGDNSGYRARDEPRYGSQPQQQPRDDPRDYRADSGFDNTAARGPSGLASYAAAPMRAVADPRDRGSVYDDRRTQASNFSSGSNAAAAELSQLQQKIDAIANDLENNLGLGSLQKQKLKKDLAVMKADFNRKQAAAGAR